MFYKDDRLAVLVDGTSTNAAALSLHMMVDWAKVRPFFSARGKIVAMAYFLGVRRLESMTDTTRPLADWLSYNGYRLVQRTVTVNQGERESRALPCYVDLTIEALRLAEACDHIVLCTGDGAYTALVAELQRRNVRVTIVSTAGGTDPTISDALRRQADNYLDLQDIIELIGKPRTGIDRREVG